MLLGNTLHYKIQVIYIVSSLLAQHPLKLRKIIMSTDFPADTISSNRLLFRQRLMSLDRFVLLLPSSEGFREVSFIIKLLVYTK